MNDMEEDDIRLWIDELDSNTEKYYKEKQNAHWFKSWIADIRFDVNYWWRYSITGRIRSIRTSIYNLGIWFNIIWNDRWWDYSFFLIIIQKKLKLMHDNWGTNTHYVGDQDDKDTIKKILDDLDWLLDDENEYSPEYEDEYKKRSKRLFGRLDRNHRKLWD